MGKTPKGAKGKSESTGAQLDTAAKARAYSHRVMAEKHRATAEFHESRARHHEAPAKAKRQMDDGPHGPIGGY